MVIHPPTLFLGFAATLIPFAYVMAGLIRGQYHEWIKPALPWTSFSVMILGIGIIMGGYWAYETLNFGGYWNWDPVENSSLVPWLCGVASLHAMLIYRKTKAYLKLTMLMIISTFLLVLYSTFLTRSGILGETSVHTFTDLGLSGQLLVLLLVYTAFVTVTMVLRWDKIPQREDESKLWSAEFMLFLGTLVFIFSGLVILFATSLPVFNAIFGTDFAPPANVQLFYYQWNVWFAILFGLISGLGQFLWWKIKGKKSFGDAIFRPFLLTVIASAATMIGLWWADMPFAYDKVFASYIDPAVDPGLGAYIRYGILSVADELLLISSLFGLFANLDVLWALLRRNRKGLKVMGGTVVHIGFALMLLGMLFSSGYDEVISTNPFPEDLSSLPDQEKVDNIPLPRGVKRSIVDFEVTYTGKKTAQAPISNLRILEETPARFKLAFRDASGETFASVQPRPPFVKGAPDDHDHSLHEGDPNAPLEGEIDLELIETLLNRDPSAFEPELINNRTQYGLRFAEAGDSSDTFTLWPEAEVNEDMGSIISHPARRIYWNRDIYVYTSSLPNPETLKPHFFNFAIRVGDTARIGNIRLWLAEVRNLSGRPEMAEYDAAAAAHLFAFTDQDTLFADPVFFIKGRQPGMIGADIPELGMELAFVGVQPEEDLINIQIRQVDPSADFVIIKAIAKPFINLLWLGTFILTAGFLVSIYRRMQENRKGRVQTSS
ncbi:MAG: hypothetical protein D6722_13065 [Bacteroidetes bacterium]|nr:MAG: hypothetical protein D6722_13065 [Bacteroidota bacterium]